MYSLKLESMFCQSELHSLKEEDKLTIEIQAESATEMVNKEVSQETEVAGQRWLSLWKDHGDVHMEVGTVYNQTTWVLETTVSCAKCQLILDYKQCTLHYMHMAVLIKHIQCKPMKIMW